MISANPFLVPLLYLFFNFIYFSLKFVTSQEYNGRIPPSPPSIMLADSSTLFCNSKYTTSHKMELAKGNEVTQKQMIFQKKKYKK